MAVLLAAFLVCVVALALATALLVLFGSRVRFASRAAGIGAGVVLAGVAAAVAAWFWGLTTAPVVIAATLIVVVVALVTSVRPRWNPIAHAFGGAAVSASLVYLAFGATVTVAGGLSPIAALASAILWVLEAVALTLSISFSFESLDVIATPDRARTARYDPAYRPPVCLQVAAYNEPPEMLIETIRSLEAIEYPNLEIVVIDNNTKDPEVLAKAG